jgi:long-chain-fatty-acid---luciferin-component ligase
VLEEESIKMAQDTLRERLAKYIPLKEEWTPVDEALYSVKDIYNVPKEKADKLRLDAIRYAFKHHYENNKFYHKYCQRQNIKPEGIKTEEDFKKIPLVPDTFFKNYPDIEKNEGKDFINWLEKIYTGEFPEVELEIPGYDHINEKLAKANIYLTHSSGSSGKFSIIARDYLTHSKLLYSILSSFKIYPFGLEEYTTDARIFTTLPDPSKSNYIGAKIWEPIISLDDSTIFKEDYGGRIHRRKLFSKYIKLMSEWEKDRKKLILLSTPSILDLFMNYIEKKRVKFNFDGFAAFYGGWINENGEKIYSEALKKRTNENFGVPEKNCRDWFIMNESNGHLVECEGGYKHIPYFIYPIVFDKEMNFLPCGEWGRFAFLDPLANSYPGFILTENRARILEDCPECDRRGMILDPEISKVGLKVSEEIKGCAAILGRALGAGRK